MGLTKQEIRDRLKLTSVWLTTSRTPFFAAVPEDRFRYIVAIWLNGNRQVTEDVTIEKLKEDGTYEEKFSPIPVAPADFRQIPEGSYSLEDPIIALEGGTRLYGKTSGISLNAEVAYWDSEF